MAGSDFDEDAETQAAHDTADREVEAARYRQAFKDVFLSVQGEVVMEYLDKTFYNTISFRPTTPDPYNVCYNEGQRSVIHAIKALITHKEDK